MLCACGADCGECEKYQKECQGCFETQGKIYWAAYIGKETCPYYECVQEKGHNNCGDCAKLPCSLWYAMKDPDWTDEQHEQSICGRVEKFRKLKEQ